MSGNARGPTTAFNLLYRLCQLKPTHSEMGMMLDHKDSPYIRAVCAEAQGDAGSLHGRGCWGEEDGGEGIVRMGSGEVVGGRCMRRPRSSQRAQTMSFGVCT